MFDRKNNLSNPSKKQFVGNLSTYFVLALALISIAFFGVCQPNVGRVLSGSAGSVDGDEITSLEFFRRYKSMDDYFRSQYGDQYNSSLLKVSKRTLNRLVDERLLYIQAQKLGFDITQQGVVNELLSNKRDYSLFFKDGKFSDSRFQEFLNRNRYTESVFFEEQQRQIAINRLVPFIQETAYASSKALDWDRRLENSKVEAEYLKFNGSKLDLSISKEEVEKFLTLKESEGKVTQWYNSHQSDYKSPEKVKARHLLVSYKGAQNSAASVVRTKEQAHEKLKKIRKDLLKSKKQRKDFLAQVKQHTDEPNGKDKGGDLGAFTRDQMVKPFSNAAFSQAPKTIGEVVETPFGYHLIYVEEKIAKKDVPLSQVKAEIAEKMIRKDKGPKLAKKLAREVLTMIKEGKDLTKKLKSLDMTWETTGPIAYSAEYIPGLGRRQDVIDDLLGLKKEQDMIDKVIYSGTSFYLFKMTKKSISQSKPLEDEERLNLAYGAMKKQGDSFLEALTAEFKRRYEEKKLIHLNENFLSRDNPPQN